MRPYHLLLLTLSILLSSCFQPEVTVELSSSPLSTVSIITRSGADADALIYPLQAYAFLTDGTLIAHQQLNSATDQLRLSLPQQTDSRIVILSADPASYDIPTSPSLTSVITLKDPTTVPGASTSGSLAKGYTTSPIQMGFADVHPQTSSTTVSIQLHYQVASLEATLTGMPTSCESAYISVATPASTLSLSGQFSGTQSIRIPLTPVPDSSPSGQSSTVPSASASGHPLSTKAPVYFFPTTGSTTTFTIAYNDANGEQYASATYQAPLQAGTPYQLHGSYSDGTFLLSGTVTPSEWADPVALDFTFTNGGNTIITPDGGNNDGDNSGGGATVPDDLSSAPYPVTTIPQPFTLWNGHIVIATVPETAPVPGSSASGSSASVPDASSSGQTAPVPDGSPSGPTATLTLLSLSDWSDLTSALHADTPTTATDLAQSYTEYDLTGWRIPTEAEARQLSQLYRDDPDTFDSLLLEAQASPIVLTDDKGNNLRYLCEYALKTYSFKNNTVTNAGATVRTYHLRLVRTLRVQQQ